MYAALPPNPTAEPQPLQRATSAASVMLSLQDLMHHLSLKRPVAQVGQEAQLRCVPRAVHPGEVICRSGEPCTDIFLVLNGVALHERAHADTMETSRLRLSGSQELLQWQASASRNAETVSAISAMEVLAIPRSAILASRVFRDCFEYALSMKGTAAVLREFRFRYTLSELNPQARLSAGLKHIVNLAGRMAAAPSFKVHLPMGTLASWLHMPAHEVQAQAERLSNLGRITMGDGIVERIAPWDDLPDVVKPDRRVKARLVCPHETASSGRSLPCSRPPEL